MFQSVSKGNQQGTTQKYEKGKRPNPDYSKTGLPPTNMHAPGDHPIQRFVKNEESKPIQKKEDDLTNAKKVGEKHADLIEISEAEAKLKLANYKTILNTQIQKNGLKDNPLIPPLIYKPEGLGSNAQYDAKSQSILVGSNFFNKGVIDGDQISIIYHEYNHYINDIKKTYPLTYNEEGAITQWETDEIISIYPTKQEIEDGIKEIMSFYKDVSQNDKSKMEQNYRSMLSQPTERKWTYAPSNLSLDEISSYKAQIKGAEIGLYELSPEYQQEILDRIIHYKKSYEKRALYEQKNNLNPDGSKKI